MNCTRRVIVWLQQYVLKPVVAGITGVVLWGALPQKAVAQADTIDQQHQRLNTRYLKPGMRQYLVYFQHPGKPDRLQLSLWVRQVEKGMQQQTPVFNIHQYWYSADTTRFATFVSTNTAADFSPLYHAAAVGKQVKAYNWSATGITGADAVADNAAAGFKLAFDQPNYNWHLDIETFEMLPLAAGKSFLIRFYDAGLEPPKYAAYRVIGSEVLATWGNREVDCWKLQTTGTYPGGTYVQTYWISKADHEFLKEVDEFGGIYRYKIKLPGLTPDLLSVFQTPGAGKKI
ncbi:hypothetical protein [Chitinophaga nivalis]|uniref:Uncharacterized protein n=1 Tax=Chitinophaga nivalis TaxID=2991709 RepID=A0ABT3IM29_9BACT|nr:hypothetical protein [Chitinophaga nivalis]MCW3465305.1 hypothetical protein [Chitinophaga nivalis]MCW3485003.1 hypothetical protein [Chitinophaga nivalis]